MQRERTGGGLGKGTFCGGVEADGGPDRAGGTCATWVNRGGLRLPALPFCQRGRQKGRLHCRSAQGAAPRIDDQSKARGCFHERWVPVSAFSPYLGRWRDQNLLVAASSGESMSITI